jgi:hypothetical protein
MQEETTSAGEEADEQTGRGYGEVSRIEEHVSRESP